MFLYAAVHPLVYLDLERETLDMRRQLGVLVAIGLLASGCSPSAAREYSAAAVDDTLLCKLVVSAPGVN